MKQEILEIAQRKYLELKMEKYPYRAPETLPGLGDTAKAIIFAVAEVLKAKES